MAAPHFPLFCIGCLPPFVFPGMGGREQILGLEAIYNYKTNTCVVCSSSDTKQFAGSTTRVVSTKQTKVTQDNVSTYQKRLLGPTTLG